MPEIEITEAQRDRLEAVQASLEADVVGKYGHVRPSDALEYLLDRYEEDVAGDGGTDGVGGNADDPTPGDGTAAGNDGAEADDDGTAAGNDGAEADDAGPDATSESAAATGGDDAVLDRMMNLLAEHDERWSESSSEARYEVELPDGSVEEARTKDDVRGLLFRHYR